MTSALASADTLRDALIAGRVSEIEGFFLNNGVSPPRISWRPEDTAIDEDRLRQLYAYWLAARRDGDGGCAPVGAVDATEMRFALGYIMLLDCVDQGEDFRYRLYGSFIAERFGRDVTGRTLRTLAGNTYSYILEFFVAAYQAAVERREPLYTVHFPGPASETRSWSRLILPLVDDQNRITRLLVGQIPGKWRPRPPEMAEPLV